MSVIVIEDENEAPAFKLEGIGPFVAMKPLPDGETVTPKGERLAGMFPVFLTVYEMTRGISPGAKGPALAVAVLAGNDETTAKMV